MRSQLDSLHYTDRARVDDDTVTLRYRETIRSSAGDELLAVTACDIVRVQDARIIAIDEYAIPEAHTALPSARKSKASCR